MVRVIRDDDGTSADSGSGSESGSDSDKSGSNSPRRAAQTPARGNESDEKSGSPQSNRSSRSRSVSKTPRKSPSRSISGSRKSRSGSRSVSGSPVRKSRSRSASKSGSGSGSGSPASRHSSKRTPSPSSFKSPTPRSPGSVRSRSSSNEKSNRSYSGSRKSRSGSRSVSGSPVRKSLSPKSGSESPKSRRSRSRSQSSKGSKRSGSAKSGGSRSRSGTPSSPPVNGKKVLSDDESPVRKRVQSNSSASNSEVGSPKAKKKVKAISDSDESGTENKESATAEALFGDADDISSEDEGSKKDKSDVDEGRSGDERRSGDEDERRSPDVEEKEEEKEEEPTPETRIDVEIPRIVCDIGRELHFVKLPNFLSVETRPFGADTYEDEIDDEETLDEEGRARLKLKVENTIRWREALDREGNTIKESNARVVKWSDGSMSLHLGNEIFDVYKQPLQGDHNHLFIRQGTGLQGQAVFRTKLTFRPHSTESFTHKKMTMSLADRSQKSTGIKVLSEVGPDPDQHRDVMIKKEEERLRATVKRESKVKRTRERGTGRPLNTSYLEPDREDGSDDDGAISLNAIKNKYNQKSDHKRQNIYSSDDEGSDLEARKPRRVDRIKALQDSDDEEENAPSVASDDS